MQLRTRLLDVAANASESDFAGGHVGIENVHVMHKYADPMPVDITMELGGEVAGRALCWLGMPSLLGVSRRGWGVLRLLGVRGRTAGAC
jgi:hypothetical protein